MPEFVSIPKDALETLQNEARELRAELVTLTGATMRDADEILTCLGHLRDGLIRIDQLARDGLLINAGGNKVLTGTLADIATIARSLINE